MPTKLAPSVEAVIEREMEWYVRWHYRYADRVETSLRHVAIAQAREDAEICKLYDPGACETSPLYIRRAILASIGVKS